MSFKQMELDLIDIFIEKYPKLRDIIKSQIDLTESIDREFSGAGIFIFFTIKSNCLKILDTNENLLRVDFACIDSDEFEHSSLATIVFDNGKIDYIELWGGFNKKDYPKSYKIKPINKCGKINYIEDICL